MLEMLLSPRKAERHPWEMFFVGLFYASLAVLVVQFLFASNPILAKYSGIFIVTFSVIFSLPFVYYAIKNEEEKDIVEEGFFRILKEHNRALLALMWLFFGFVVAFSFWYIILGTDNNFRAQIEVYCQINQPGNVDGCVSQYQMKTIGTTGYLTSTDKIVNIFFNNVTVLIVTLAFSLFFGAGAIFILAWNASVIAAAIGIFTKYQLASLPLGIARYMIHGLPEILAYFIAAMAGGIVSIAIVRHDYKSEKFWSILQDSLNLIIIALIVLFIAALIEVFITPTLF